MKRTVRRLALIFAVGLAAAPWAVRAEVFGTGPNGVYWNQQSSQKSQDNNKDKDKDNGPAGGPSYNGPPFDTPRSYDRPTSQQVPEPESLGLVAIGLLALWAASRRRKD